MSLPTLRRFITTVVKIALSTCAAAWMVAAFPDTSYGHMGPPVPEVNPGAAVGALTLLISGALLVRRRLGR